MTVHTEGLSRLALLKNFLSEGSLNSSCQLKASGTIFVQKMGTEDRHLLLLYRPGVIIRLTLLLPHISDRNIKAVHLRFRRHFDLSVAVQMEQKVPCQDSYHQDTGLGIYV